MLGYPPSCPRIRCTHVQGGFAHVIENERKFPKSFGFDILAGAVGVAAIFSSLVTLMLSDKRDNPHVCNTMFVVSLVLLSHSLGDRDTTRRVCNAIFVRLRVCKCGSNNDESAMEGRGRMGRERMGRGRFGRGRWERGEASTSTLRNRVFV
jgi:hypothetical protein